MLVKVKLTGKRRQMFHTNEYLIGPLKDMHPDILEATITTDDGKKKLAHIKRPHPKHYEKYDYKPLPPHDPVPPQEAVQPEPPAAEPDGPESA